LLLCSQEKDKPNSTTMNGSTGGIGTAEQMGVKMEPAEAESYSMSGSSGVVASIGSHNGINYVSPEQEELINRLVYFQDEYEQPNEEDVKRITVRMSSRARSIIIILMCPLIIIVSPL
jgi:ecdysone receptor